MENTLIYPIGVSKSCQYAARRLHSAGFSLIDHPSPDVTHLLLDIPSFSSPGILRSDENLHDTLSMLPDSVTVIGGGLDEIAAGNFQVIDLLKDAVYLAQNAAITADCALQVAAPHLNTILPETPVLIIGWGRIGKCLGDLLLSLGCPVTVAARKRTDRAMLRALGYNAVDISGISKILPSIRLLFNTVPESILPQEVLEPYRACVKIDLASRPGISASDVICARGLPGTYAPESSGKLIAKTIVRLI